MARWTATIDIKKFINDETLSYRQQALGVASVLHNAVNTEPFVPVVSEALMSISERICDVLADDDVREECEASGDEEPLAEEVNYVLEDLYDLADNNRIWLG